MSDNMIQSVDCSARIHSLIHIDEKAINQNMKSVLFTYWYLNCVEWD